MQAKKRICGRNASKEHASPRISRAQKKLSENVQDAEKKVSELITSSARKQKCTFPKKNQEPIAATNLNTRYNSVHHEASNASQCDVVDPKGFNEGAAQCVVQAIFSPAFHTSKIAGGEISDGVDFIKLYWTGESWVDILDAHLTQETFKPSYGEHDESTLASLNTTCRSVIEVEKYILAKSSYVDNYGDQVLSTDATTVNYCDNAVSNGVGLPSEVSSIYLAMKNSKLECVDEHGQDSMSTDVCLEEEEDYEEFDDFDPYLFIKNLPELSSVVPTFRPMLLPKQTRSCPPTTLVLDLDETLVHSTLEPCDDADFTFPVNFNLQQHTVFVRCRPYLRDFMERVSSIFEIIIFTASQSIYAEQLLNVLDPKRRVFRHRVFRESCVFVEGNYLKDLSVLGRDLAHVIIIDNSPQAFGFQVDNGIPIESWFDDREDKELLSLLPFLESLVGVEDVRPVIAKKYNLQRRIAAAVYPPLNSSRDPFER